MDTVNPMAESSQDRGGSKEREGRLGGEGRKVVFVYSPAYLD